MRARRLVACAIVAALGGCASVTRPPATVADLPASFRNAASDVAGAASSDAWWREFNDATLDALETRAVDANPTLAEAADRIRAARLLERPASARFLPNLQAHTTSAPNVESTASYFQAGFDSQWELGLFGKAGAEGRIATITTEEAEIERAAARLSVSAELAREYFALRYAQRADALAREAGDAALEARAFVQSRRNLGLATDADLVRAAQAAESAQEHVEDAALRVERGRIRIAALCGVATPPPELDAPADPPALPAAPPSALPADLLRRRPDLRRAEAQMRKAAAELDVARAERWPQISLVGDLTYAAKIDGDELLSPRRLTTIGPGISIPLFDWGARKARADARRAALDASGMAYRAAVLDAVAEAETLLATYAFRARRSARADQSLAAQARLEQAAAKRNALGLADRAELVASRQQSLAAREALLASKGEQAESWIALYKALGGAPESAP